MKAILLFAITILWSINTFAQLSDKVLARAYYTFISEGDSSSKKIRTENMILFLGKSTSLYTSLDKIKFEISEDQKAVARVMANTGNGNAPRVVKIDKSAGDWLSKTSYMFWQNEKKLYSLENFAYQFYLIEDKHPEMKWKIQKDTLTISGIACKKATTSYDNKNWTAWFAADIQFPNGPWLLHGLPGLIIEAYSENKDIQYLFAGFENAKPGDFVRTNDVKKNANYQPGQISPVDVGMGLGAAYAYFDNLIKIPTYQTVKTNEKELLKLKDAYKNDPKGFRKTIFGF